MSPRAAGAAKAPLRLDPVTRRALLVQAAAEVFRGRDPSEVSFEEVAEAGGVSRSLVYAYFGDRGGLIAAVYLHNLEQLDRDLGKALDDRLPDEVRLRRIIRRYLVFARDNEASWNVMAAAGALQHPAIQAARRERIERIAASWAARPPLASSLAAWWGSSRREPRTGSTTATPASSAPPTCSSR